MDGVYYLLQKTSISVSYKTNQTTEPVSYILQWKQAITQTSSWDDSSKIGSKQLEPGATTAMAVDLEPGTTYCLRLVVPSSNMAGPELFIDTEQVGCTPGQKNGCCVIS